MKNTVSKDTLTFETFAPDEVQKRALNFDQSKQAFQKLHANTASAAHLSGSQIKIKQESIFAVGNKGQTNRRPNKEQYERKTNDMRNNARPRAYQKPCTRYETAFMEGHLKNCLEMRKSRKNCTKSNQFTKTCQSYKINEVTANTKSSDEECELIQNFDSCDEF